MAVKRLEQNQERWTEQQTASIRVAFDNVLTTTKQKLEEEVRRRYREDRIEKQFYRFLAPTLGISVGTETFSRSDYFEQVIVPKAETAFGIAVDYETSGGPRGRPRDPRLRDLADKLTAAKAFVNNLQPRQAKQILVDLKEQDLRSDSQILADYLNCVGIVNLHEGAFAAAFANFRKAVATQPESLKYRMNALSAEYLASRSGGGATPFSTEWKRRLDDLLQEAPDSVQLVRIKLHVLAEETGADWSQLEEYLKKTAIWSTDTARALALLAEVASDSGDPALGLKALEDAEAQGLTFDGQLHALRGYLFLRAAYADGRNSEFSTVRGFGPAYLDPSLLMKSRAAYELSLRDFAARGYPPSAEESFHNAATVSVIIGDSSTAERICQEFLSVNPESARVRGALALALMHRDLPMRAVPHAKAAYASNLNDSTAFHNLILLQLQAREYDALLETVAEREVAGFVDEEEEKFGRQLAAIAYAQSGEDKLAERQVDLIKNKLGDGATAAATELRVQGIQGVAPDELTRQAQAWAETYPDNVPVLESVLQVLRPLSASNAEQTADCLKRIGERRQLGPHELLLLGQALLLSRSFTEAEAVFQNGRVRFPVHAEFIFEHALSLAQLDEEEASRLAIDDYVQLVGSSYETYASLGMLAARTGRIKDAIDAFQRALGQTRDPKERGKIHLQLYELKRLASSPVKERLLHAMAYGETTDGDPEAEARFLTMCLMLPLTDDDFRDPEVAATKDPIAKRLNAFCDEHPRFQGLLRIKIPAQLKGLELYNFLAAEAAAIFLPGRLRSEQAELALRSVPWPLQSRAEVVRPQKSVFEYFDECVVSRDFAHALHVLHPPLDFTEEVRSVDIDRPVCSDLATLLLLDHVDLLEEVLSVFPRFYLSASTRIVLDLELAGYEAPHPRAIRLQEIITKYRRKVRFRQPEGLTLSTDEEDSFRFEGGLWIEKKEKLTQQLNFAGGDAALVARQLRIPFYSDESVLRYVAAYELDIPAFGTLALLCKLRVTGRMAIEDEALLLSKLINSNCVYVQFLAEHLHSRLLSVIRREEFKERPPGKEDLQKDDVLGVFLLEFGNPRLSVRFLLGIAIRWWAVLCRKQSVPQETLVQLVATVSWKLAHRDLGSVLTGVLRDDPVERLAYLFAGLWHAGYQGSGETNWVWQLIKSAAEHIYKRDEKTYEDIIFSRMPKLLAKIVEAEPELDAEQKVTAIVQMTQQLPSDDREAIEKEVFRAATWMRQ